MERKENRERRGASWEVPQQSGPIEAQLWDVSGSPEPSLTISFIRKESFKPNLKGREDVCFLKPNWQLVPQRGAWQLKALTPIPLLETLGTTSKPAVLEQSYLLGRYPTMRCFSLSPQSCSVTPQSLCQAPSPIPTLHPTVPGGGQGPWDPHEPARERSADSTPTQASESPAQIAGEPAQAHQTPPPVTKTPQPPVCSPLTPGAGWGRPSSRPQRQADPSQGAESSQQPSRWAEDTHAKSPALIQKTQKPMPAPRVKTELFHNWPI